MSRPDGRANDELRAVAFVPDFMRSATGSVLIEQGETRVICTASVEESVPRWMKGQGRGWVTAEYGMLPASTGDRKPRDVSKGRPDGRTVEIQRLIGRALPAVVDFEALALAIERLIEQGSLMSSPLTQSVAAISCGIVDGEPRLDLDYLEDSGA